RQAPPAVRREDVGGEVRDRARVETRVVAHYEGAREVAGFFGPRGRGGLDDGRCIRLGEVVRDDAPPPVRAEPDRGQTLPSGHCRSGLIGPPASAASLPCIPPNACPPRGAP